MVTIIGPTSSGKTSLALKLCAKYDGEIISADSRQLYKKMDVGTGKIPVCDGTHTFEGNDNYWLIDGIRVYGYDLCYPNEMFSANDFKTYFNKTYKTIVKRKKKVFLVGGTGLYIDFALGNMSPTGVPVDYELRSSLNTLSLEELQSKLPNDVLNQMNKSDRHNPRRLIRRIEILKSNQTANSENSVSISDNKIIGLTAERTFLYKRVDRWVDLIWDKLVTETKLLIILGYKESPPLNGLIYKTVKGFLNKEIDDLTARENIKYDLHKYIRRQQTWFKKMKGVRWFDISDYSFFDDVEKYIA